MEKRTADFVFVYPSKHTLNEYVHEFIRIVKEDALLEVEEEEIPAKDDVLVKIYAPFCQLSKTAEILKLKMPLPTASEPLSLAEEVVTSESGECLDWNLLMKCWEGLVRNFESEPQCEDVSTTYTHNEGLFENIEEEESFFRPALRSLLAYHILTSIDVSKEKGAKRQKGLLYLQMKGAIKTSFTLHDPSVYFKKNTQSQNGFTLLSDNDSFISNRDDIALLNTTWAKPYLKLQPLCRIRNYFGEKIALYFAFVETLQLSLIIPALIGFCIFIYGLHLSIVCHRSTSEHLMGQNIQTLCQSSQMLSIEVNKTLDNIRGKCHNLEWRRRMIVNTVNQTCLIGGSYIPVQVTFDDVSTIIKSSLDNDATPVFALIVCLWGTVFLELWKRKTATLAHKWKVKDYESNEPDRTEFVGSKIKKDLVTGAQIMYYPTKLRYMKIFVSFSVLLLLVGLVLVSVFGVVVYKTVTRIWVQTKNPVESYVLSSVVSAFLNMLSIMILGQIYQRIAIKMTEWENYRTQTAYNDALIKKLFAFQFANSYASLFYIAFLRGSNRQVFRNVGLEGLEDDCGMLNNCISELSIQLLVVMLLKPLPKFCKDVIYPFVKRLVVKTCLTRDQEDPETTPLMTRFILHEKRKPDLGNFTLEEYNEKVIQYGYQMLFAACFPLGPLLFFITLWVDKWIDAKRLLWMYRRPVAWIAQDIGPWYTILELINAVAVLTNACLIAFSAQYGRERPLVEQLTILIVFEHIVFVVKFIVANIIPDLPQRVKLAIKQESYKVEKEKAKKKKMT
ncbi:anoctamin-10-like isoform X2 [Polyodon spathula]|uniref:anoctamin-10-like isoform X2 n=1 Tax=Polyodon spathula TaxID=7913 RepID=UPI001B7DC0AD|nr:anoctamin-10-like isoform X2 [Polyodon spathula]